MEIPARNNTYAQLLEEQGCYVINVGGVDWVDYKDFMVPAYLPHCCPVITQDLAIEVLRKSGRAFVRWGTKFGEAKDSEWWYILKKGQWKIESVPDKKKRWMIRQGKKNFKVRLLTLEEAAIKCPKVAQLAASRYKGEAKVESEEMLAKYVSAAKKVPGVLEYMGCFYNDELVGFSENYIQDNAVWLATIRYDPAYLGKYSSYGFLDGILRYYLNEKKLLYVLDGCRNIYHRTDFQEHLIKVFGFTKEYAFLDVVYRPWFAMGIKAAFAFRGAIWGINRRWTNGTLDKVGGILKQEEIRRVCNASKYLSDR